MKELNLRTPSALAVGVCQLYCIRNGKKEKMIDSYIRPILQKKFIDRWASISFFKNVHPIYITIISCIAGLICAIFIYLKSPLIALFFYDPIYRAIPTLLISGGILLCVSSFLVVGIFSQNTSEKSFHYSPGIIERAEAFLFFSCMILFPISFTYAGYIFAFSMMVTSIILQQKHL